MSAVWVSIVPLWAWPGYCIASVNREMVLNYVAQRTLGPTRSY